MTHFYRTLYLLFFFTLLPSTLSAATITAQVDRNPVQMNESFQLIFEAAGSVDDDPDFSLLEKDFEILNQGNSSNISIINGSFKRSTQWILSMMPLRPGSFTIPSIAFGKDLSPQLRLTVKAAAKNSADAHSEFFAESEVSTQKTYVQAQILLTQRLYSAVNLSAYEMSEPGLKQQDAVVEKLAEDNKYQTQLGGRPYLVIERRYAIYPQQSGTLHIDAFIAKANLVNRSNSRYDPFRRNSRLKQVQSSSHDIKVSAIPAQFTGRTWLPANEIQLVEQWPNQIHRQTPSQTPRFTVGEPVTRTLSLLADGLTSAQLPEINPPALADIKQYPDQPVLHDTRESDGIVGIREEKIALIPTRAGRYTLPAISIPWWNVKTGKMQTASIPPQQIEAVAAAGQGAGNSAGNDAGSRLSSNISPTTGDPSTTGALAFNTPGDQTTLGRSDNATWPVISLILGLGWLSTVALWWFKQRQAQAVQTAQTDRVQPLNQAMKRLKKACGDQNPSACHEPLLKWGQSRYADAKISNLGQLAQQAGEPLATEIQQLESRLYGPKPADASHDWNSHQLVDICQQITDHYAKKQVAATNTLEPLYK